MGREPENRLKKSVLWNIVFKINIDSFHCGFLPYGSEPKLLETKNSKMTLR